MRGQGLVDGIAGETSRRSSLRALPVAIFAAFVSLADSGCLPRGDAPAGRQILADKTASLLGLVPANGDGLLRVLFFRPGKDADNFNLWVLAVDPNGGPSSEQMLFTDIDSGLVLGYRPTATSLGTGIPSDSQGRLFLSETTTGGPGVFSEEVLRVDPVTGETVDLGQGSFAAPLGGGPFLISYNGPNQLSIYNPDGTITVLDVLSSSFLGDNLFYVTPDGVLMRLGSTGVSEQLATGVATMTPFNAQTVLITRAVSDPSMPAPPPTTDPLSQSSTQPAQVTAALLDTTTLVETPLPAGPLYQNYPTFSPSGRWLIVAEPSPDPSGFSGPLVLVDSLTGTIEPLDSVFQYGTWRPGHDEIWVSQYDPNQTGLLSDTALSIKTPGQPVVVIPGRYFERFSDDGASWFSRGAPFGAQDSSDLVGPADDPAGPRFPAVPFGSSLGDLWLLSDGRILDDSFVGLDSFENSYVQTVDPRNGATQLVGELGYLSAVGQTRALGIYHVSFLRGDLTTTDFATGQATVLAPEFAMAAVAEPMGTDPYPPGGRIVYQFGARFESPWDGLWMATVP